MLSLLDQGKYLCLYTDRIFSVGLALGTIPKILHLSFFPALSSNSKNDCKTISSSFPSITLQIQKKALI